MYYEGDNDVIAKRKPEEIRDDVKAFVEKVRTALPDVPVHILSIKPSPSRAEAWPAAEAANKLLRKYAVSAKAVSYVDVATEMMKNGKPCEDLFLKDMLHMNAEGYALWTRKVKESLQVK